MYLNFTVLLLHYSYHYLRNRRFIACDYQVKTARGIRVEYEAIAEGFTRIFLKNVGNFSDKNALKVAVKRFCVNNFIWHVSTLGIP